jgi:hypothetical protein
MATDQELKQKIIQANKNELNKKEFESLPSNVDYFVDVIWNGHYNENKKIYFIKNAKNKYVGIVEDGGNDLHWYILPYNRGNGHLTKALREVILPHLLRDRDTQRITINEGFIGKKMAIASERIALCLGFKEVWNGDYFKIFILNKSEVNFS